MRTTGRRFREGAVVMEGGCRLWTTPAKLFVSDVADQMSGMRWREGSETRAGGRRRDLGPTIG